MFIEYCFSYIFIKLVQFRSIRYVLLILCLIKKDASGLKTSNLEKKFVFNARIHKKT
ncbi:hypothetical protein BpHYR1_029272 [Brachionus plicatilis]|uniref:Uncharacterized protein n=1 Tax=Brachionus plicatilis TaxID=10195 RepID=A0A3M7PCF9_BRAPC|nr:hypothetical protein BpHYR1_029272 [Brachionus plicatilis]